MFLLTDIVAAFIFSGKKKKKKEKEKKKQMNQVYWKAFLVYLVKAPILNTT